MSWFVLSLIAILFWSGSDLFSKIGAKPNDTSSHWKMVITSLPASACCFAAMVIGYAGLRYIELSISSPVCNSSGAVGAVLGVLFLHETMTGLQVVGVVLVCAGVFALSVIEKRKDDALRAAEGFTPDVKHTRSLIAIAFPLLYCAIDGLGTFMDGLLLNTVIAEEQANIAYEFTFLLMGVFAFVYAVLIKKAPITLPTEGPKLLGALCETAGQFAYIYAIGANLVVAAPMISSYCVASLIWSRIFLKEKLSKSQYAVIAVAAVGIIILGME